MSVVPDNVEIKEMEHTKQEMVTVLEGDPPLLSPRLERQDLDHDEVVV